MHSGAPEPVALGRLILDRRTTRFLPRAKARAIRTGGAKRRIPFVIRIDDVVCKEPALSWLLDALAARGLRASLEVVPYLMEFDEGFLDRFDPRGKLFEVSQHGYAHVPRTAESGRRCEFSPESAAPTAEELDVIARGKRLIERAFPRRFTGGFSPPYDALPSWLPAMWHSLDGKFVSCLFTNSMPDAPLPVRRAGVDVWDWKVDRALSPDRMKRKLTVQFAVDGHAGIVLHPRCLRRRSDKLHLLSLLNQAEEGTATVSLKDLALGLR
jgi:peptidoglycan/xylan/chitin deacetylase (PgdA/CDA1 family)